METRDSPFSNNRDRISNLPDTLIHHILSFLDMKYVVQTSVLSRRWRYLWTSLPTLNFDYYLFYSSETETVDGFIDFVDKVLILRDNSNIQRFHLVWYDCVTVSRINTWIIAAVRRNVQEISIDINGVQSFRFPQYLFTCKSLTKLELDMGGKEYTELILPNSMGLPRLKFLKLCALYIDVEKSTDDFFSSCPVLESLIITDTNMNIDISSLTLRHLKLDNCGDFRSYYYGDKTVKLYAPNLISFSCKDFMSREYFLENLSSLVTADINMVAEDSEEDENPDIYLNLPAVEKELYAHHMMEFLRKLHNVKELRLSPGFVEVVLGAPEIIDDQLPQFCNLQRLKLQTRLSRDSMHAITNVLRISPNIESLFLSINPINLNSANIDWEAGLLLPCMLYHLKFVQIRGVVGCLDELKFLEILLKNAVLLEKIVLFISKAGSIGRVSLREKLLTLQRACSSSSAISIFES